MRYDTIYDEIYKRRTKKYCSVIFGITQQSKQAHTYIYPLYFGKYLNSQRLIGIV